MFSGDEFGPERPAFAWGGHHGPRSEEGWQPWAYRERGPWDRPFGRPFGPRFERPFVPPFWRMAKRFGFGPGGPFGPGGGFGPGPRMFGRGDLKYALLELLRERPKHGYEMIKELEERAGGFYTPSAGAIYPTLQLLEDRGWVTSETQEGKKVYTITEDGRKALTERHERESEFGPRGHWGEWGPGPRPHGPHHHHRGPFGREVPQELHALRRESSEVARLMRAAVMVSDGDPERLARLQAIVARAKGDLNEFLGQGRRGESAPASGTEGEPSTGPVENL